MVPLQFLYTKVVSVTLSFHPQGRNVNDVTNEGKSQRPGGHCDSIQWHQVLAARAPELEDNRGVSPFEASHLGYNFQLPWFDISYKIFMAVVPSRHPTNFFGP